MAEAFRQGMFMYVGGMLFCIASVILILLFTQIGQMDRYAYRSGSVAYDDNTGYHFEDIRDTGL